MLILTRRRNEKVRFPNLGITIKVLTTGMNKIQLGVDAPPEIRVIRDELAFNGTPQGQNPLDHHSASSLQQELNGVAIAIRLCQNQLQQGLSDHAEQALDDAIASLQRLETRISEMEAIDTSNCHAVRENTTPYRICNRPTINEIVENWLSTF